MRNAIATIAFAGAAAASAAFSQRGLARWRAAELEREDAVYNADVPPETRFAVAVLGGLRGVASEFVRLHADNLQKEGKFVELAQLSAWLTQLDPHSPESWTMAAWNLSYNISAMSDAPEEKWRWVEAGLKLLRDDGLRVNPRDPAIHYELLWLFLNKISGATDDAGRFYNETWREIAAAAAERGDWESLGMDEGRMRRIDAEYGPLDWGDPVSSAIYWGEDGLERTTPEFSLRLRMGIGLCLMSKIRADPSYAPKALERLEALGRRGERSQSLDEMAATVREFIENGGTGDGGAEAGGPGAGTDGGVGAENVGAEAGGE